MQTSVGWSWSFYGVGYYRWCQTGAWDLAVKEEKDQEKRNSGLFHHTVQQLFSHDPWAIQRCTMLLVAHDPWVVQHFGGPWVMGCTTLFPSMAHGLYNSFPP